MGKYANSKGFPYSLPSVSLELIPVHSKGSQIIHPVVGCHYFLPGLQLPSQPQSITAPPPWLVST